MSDKIFGKPITREERSRIMSRIRSSGSKLERRVRDALVGANIGCQEQAQVLGKPDFYIPEAKCALFVDSAFWHGHTLSFIAEKLRPDWRLKIERNVARDLYVDGILKKDGFRVIRLLEADLTQDFERTMKGAIRLIRFWTTLERKQVLYS